MNYVGFWDRFYAGWVDFIILLPFWFLFLFLDGLSKDVAIIVAILSPVIYWFYNIYFHGKWGATLGKMALKIKVVKEKEQSMISSMEQK